MKSLCLTFVVLLAGCASTSERPAVDRHPYPEPDFSGVVDNYVTTVLDTVDVASLPPNPGVTYVRAQDPRLTPPSFREPLLEQQAVRGVLSGFTCPVRGVVYVSAIVAADGAVLAPRLRSGIDETCDARALAVVESAVFTPARLSGEPVAALVTLPIRFN